MGLALAAALLVGAPALALSVDDTSPIYFPASGSNTGIAPPRAPNHFTDLADPFLCAGGGAFIATGWCTGLSAYQLLVESQVLTDVHQFPQLRGDLPTATDPLIADTIWTVRNTTGSTLLDAILIFSSVDLTAYPGGLVPSGYPNLTKSDDPSLSAFGLDADLLGIMEFATPGSSFFYGVGELGDLAPGEAVEITVRYIIANGPMPFFGNDVVLPPFRVLGHAVPEPSVVLLLVSGLAGLAVRGRRRPRANR